MELLFYAREAVFVILCVGPWMTENALAEISNLKRDTRSSDGQNYFFYQQSEFPRDCHDVLQECSLSISSGVYVIKPDGYPEPFDVYCHNDASSGGWTVIQRRVGVHVSYNRLWKDYRDGFGFLSEEFWLGNEKISFLTNQGLYELRADMQLSNGSSFYITYSGFRIGDDWDEYRLVNVGEYQSHGNGVITPCPRNMVYGNCTCQGTCEEPRGPSGSPPDYEYDTEGCFCPAGFLMSGDECVSWSECPCFWSEVSLVIPNNQSQVNSDCTRRRSCADNQLTNEEEYQCGSHARCAVEDNLGQCYCNDGFRGDGQTCDTQYVDCHDAYIDGQRRDGVYLIKPTDWPETAFNVTCVMSTDGGGWTVFQRRTDGHTDFYRNWTSYRDGFGSSDGDFWLGNEKLYYLTNQRSYKLRVDLVTAGNTAKYAEYSTFRIGTEEDKYRLTATGPSGSTGSYMNSNNGKAFSTYDNDNDACSTYNFAEMSRGAWWYSNGYCSRLWGDYCNYLSIGSRFGWCTHSNLNGDYNGDRGGNIFWYPDCNINFVEMKMRPHV